MTRKTKKVIELEEQIFRRTIENVFREKLLELEKQFIYLHITKKTFSEHNKIEVMEFRFFKYGKSGILDRIFTLQMSELRGWKYLDGTLRSWIDTHTFLFKKSLRNI